MRKIAEVISWLSLVVTILAPVAFYMGAIPLNMNKIVMNTATAIWFGSALFWIDRKKEAERDS